MTKHLTRFYLGFAFLCIIGLMFAVIYGIWWTLLMFPVVFMWIGIVVFVCLSYIIGMGIDEMKI